MKCWFVIAFLPFVLMLTACGADQSMFQPAGSDAEKVLVLFWTMTIGFTLIFCFVMGLIVMALIGPEHWRRRLKTERLILGLGLVFPIFVLSALLFWGYTLLGSSGQGDARPDLRISVMGEQWWWRVTYLTNDGRKVETANEIRIPVGKSIELELVTADVLHSFWVPAWAGKMDMIPGRTNRLRFTVDQAGTVKGQCAEYCGGAHAFMSLYGIAMEPKDFEFWLDKEFSPAHPLPDHKGQQLFLSSGCGSCHQIRGIVSLGDAGPDLTHVGSRLSLGAGILSNDTEAFETWLAHHPVLKPENRMPAFDFLNPDERRQLARFLDSLE